MKRSFVYLVLALMLSLLLSACGDMSDRGSVASSPWPDVTNPVLPVPTTQITATPNPTFEAGSSTGTGSGGSFESGAGTGSGMTGSATSSPMPTETDR